MKNLIVLIAFTFLSISSSIAQVEISSTPLSLVFGRATLGVEAGINKKVGFLASVLYTPFRAVNNSSQISREDIEEAKLMHNEIGYFANVKYYFKPITKLDGVYAGIYARDLGTNYRKGLRSGLNIGYKHLAKSNLFFDISIGAGLTKTNDALIAEYLLSLFTLSNQISDKKFYNDRFGKLSLGYRF